LYETVLKKSQGQRKLNHLIVYSYFLEMIGQSKEALALFPEILMIDSTKLDQHIRYINEILTHSPD